MYSSTLPQNPAEAGAFGISADEPVEKSISSYLTRVDLSQILYPMTRTRKNGIGKYVVMKDDTSNVGMKAVKPPNIMTRILTVKPSIVLSVKGSRYLFRCLKLTVRKIGLERSSERKRVAVNSLSFQPLLPTNVRPENACPRDHTTDGSHIGDWREVSVVGSLYVLFSSTYSIRTQFQLFHSHQP